MRGLILTVLTISAIARRITVLDTVSGWKDRVPGILVRPSCILMQDGYDCRCCSMASPAQSACRVAENSGIEMPGGSNFPAGVEDEMSKMKTKSGAKKRFKITAAGKVMALRTGKRHGMIKRTPKQIRQKRGFTALAVADARIVKRSYMPYLR